MHNLQSIESIESIVHQVHVPEKCSDMLFDVACYFKIMHPPLDMLTSFGHGWTGGKSIQGLELAFISTRCTASQASERMCRCCCIIDMAIAGRFTHVSKEGRLVAGNANAAWA